MSGKTESRYRQVQDRVRGFNKRILNPFVLRLAGRPLVPYGVVRHVGRRSGREYDTPVLVSEVGDQFVVPLPYGTDVDWYQNVRAADECVVVHGGHAYRVESPRLVDSSAVPDAFPTWQEEMIREAGSEQYLRMDRGEEVPTEYGEIARKYPSGPAVAGIAGAVLGAAVLWRAVRR
jgi:deazaflavin-dependent oxidoreductase (nitroreductase family)